MAYRVEFDPAAKRDMKRVPKQFLRDLFDEISALQEDPEPPCSTLLVGYKGIHRIRLSHGYRAAYTIDQGKLIVLVLVVGDRREIYEMLSRRV